MSWKKKDSDHKLRLRAQKPREDRETLIPCPVCEGEGSLVITSPTQYRMRICRWCNGTSAVSHQVSAIFRRWERIRGVNRLAGRCAK